MIESVCFRDGTAPAVLDALQHCVAAHFPISLTHSTFPLEPPAHTRGCDMKTKAAAIKTE